MKAITIWQPWASLLACGGKRFETRSWATFYNGPIAIHAAAISVHKVLEKLFPFGEHIVHPDYQAKVEFLAALSKAFGIPETDITEYLKKLPTGAVIATANLIGCHRIGRLPKYEGEGVISSPMMTGCWDCNFPGHWVDVSEQEIMFGDWSEGRYAWELSNMKIITPVPAGGRQGLWEWEEKTK